jgi:hypothetical protein
VDLLVPTEVSVIKIRRPCENCPWRVDAPRGYWDPSHFEEIWKNCQDDGMNQMACHKSTAERPLPCQGWVRVMGFRAIGVRLLVMRDHVSEAEVADRDGPALFPSFAAMLRANRVRPPRRNRFLPVARRR